MDVQSNVARGAPKYWALREWVRGMISRGEVRPGELLPTEPELCARFKVSRGTVRRAFDDLERDGLVVREPGRGTFVAVPRMERPLPELTSFTEHVRSLGMKPGGRLVEYTAVEEPGGGGEHFGVGGPLLRIVRVRTANDQAVGVHTLILPQALAVRAGFTADALRAEPELSFYQALSGIGVHIDLARERLAARSPTAQERRLLLLGARQPVLEICRRTYDINGVPIEQVRAVYRADRYDYVTWLRRPPHAGPAGQTRTGGGLVNEETV